MTATSFSTTGPSSALTDARNNHAIESTIDACGMTFQCQKTRERVLRNGIYALGEAYEQGLWDAEQLDYAILRAFHAPASRPSPLVWARLGASIALQLLVDRQAGRKAFNIGQQHYDLGNDLFRTMLDQSMTYTSGYWNKATSLNDAQNAKLELLCRKLDIQPGQRVLDIGCGWGNFAEYAARNYGADVVGVTVSKEQAALARERCAELPVDIRLLDYRDLDETFDHVVSIEMIEAVGRRNIPHYFGVVDRCLKQGGRFALQVITGDTMSRTSNRQLDQFIMWLRTYIFPDGYLPKEQELTPPPATALRIQDWHRFVGDYEQTLLAWSQNFNARWDDIAPQYGEQFHRRWNFYLHSCVAAFQARLIDVQQIIYSKGPAPERFEPVR